MLFHFSDHVDKAAKDKLCKCVESLFKKKREEDICSWSPPPCLDTQKEASPCLDGVRGPELLVSIDSSSFSS